MLAQHSHTLLNPVIHKQEHTCKIDVPIENGTHDVIDGISRVYYEGYWIRYYEAPTGNLKEKKHLVQALCRRLFTHMEHGINIPGKMLDQTRAVYEAEDNPRKKRIKGAMLAGALFNRAADIFNYLVELEERGIEIAPDNDLMHTCGMCLREALEFGKFVKHRNGDEGIDELWGEPFKAFIMPIDAFYESRYIKIAMTMKNIDEIARYMGACMKCDPRFPGIEQLILEYASAARSKCETMCMTDNIYDINSDFVVAGEAVMEFEPVDRISSASDHLLDIMDIRYMMKTGIRLIASITRSRTPMPVSTKKYFSECEQYTARLSSKKQMLR